MQTGQELHAIQTKQELPCHPDGVRASVYAAAWWWTPIGTAIVGRSTVDAARWVQPFPMEI